MFNFQNSISKKKNIYLPKDNFFLNNNYSPHLSFVRPPIIRKLYYQEEPKTFADSIWMKNRDLYKFRKKENSIQILFT